MTSPPTPRLTEPMARLLANIRRAGRRPFETSTVAEARRAYARGAELLDFPRRDLARVEALQIPAADGSRNAARLYAPSADRLPVLLYLHGGGFTIGDLETHDSLCRQLAARSGAAVIAIDYRRAPEHRFPGAVDDAWAALDWLASAASAPLGLDTGRLAVGGDSAGGTLAAVCTLKARDAGLALRQQVLITPGTGATGDTDSHRRFAHGYLLEAETMAWFFQQYIDPADRHDWRYAPLLADDLEGVAPACVVLAECDPLVDEGIAYADRLRAAGVPVELEIHRGVTHDFIKLGRLLPEAGVAQAMIGNRLSEAFSASA